jgi:replicative DNA helicase
MVVMDVGAGDLIRQEIAVKKSYERFKFNREQEWGLYGHDTGIHSLNMMIGGWIPSKVTTIAARSGHGKTAMTVQMFDAGRRIGRNRMARFIFFTWEMESSYLVDRHICYKTGITNRLLGQGAKLLGKEFMKNIHDAYKDAYSLPVIYQQYTANISQVREIFLKFVNDCEKQSRIEGVDIIPVGVVDYIGMAKGEGKNNLKTYDIGDFVNGIKKIVNETNGAFCLFAQISRAADEKDLPQRSDLSDSAAIENASDNLILLHRPEYVGAPTIKDPDTVGKEEVSAEGKALLRALKSRDFGTGDKLISCDIAYNRFYDRSHSWDMPYWKMYKEEKFWMYELGFDPRKPNFKELCA